MTSIHQTTDSSPVIPEGFEGLTIPQALNRQARLLGNEKTAIRQKAYGIWKRYTWSDYLDFVKYTGLGLHQLGLEREHIVALVLDNEPEWLFCELAAQSFGGISINLFTSAVAKEIISGINRVEASFVIVQDQEQVDKLLENQDQLPTVKKVVYVDPTGMRNYRDIDWLVSYADLIELGKTTDQERPDLYETELQKGGPNDTAIMLMTSGTTGVPKMVMLSHENIADMAGKWLLTSPITVGDNWISISPPAWIVDQMWGFGVTLFGGMVMNFPETEETITEDFREIGPSTIITSSRFWEDLASKIRVKISDAGPIKRLFFKSAQRVGMKVILMEEKRQPIPTFLKFKKWFFNLTVSRQLLDRVGCLKFKTAYTGGHPISPEVIRFFRANGLNLMQCYGMTESGGIFQVQPEDRVKPETVGVTLPGTEIKIAEDQEVMVASRSIFKGYYQNQKSTDEAIVDGWFMTGDAGYFDDDNQLVILGRKQDIMRTREDEPFSPDFIETRLKFSPYIKEAVIWGEGQEYLSAFINIDFENVGNWAEEHKIPYTTYLDLSKQIRVEELIIKEVKEVNSALTDAMRLKKILLLHKLLDADDEELTRTGKVRRKFVAERYKNLIDTLYSDETEVYVKGQVNYRDGTVGTLESNIKILPIE